MDFVTWMFCKHYVITALGMPSWGVAYGIYMKWPLYTLLCGMWFCALNYFVAAVKSK